MNDNIYLTRRKIYGINIYTVTNDEYIILFERKYDTLMSNEMIIETKLFYENLNEDLKKIIKFKIYTKCKSIYNKDELMIWLNISSKDFVKCFHIK